MTSTSLAHHAEIFRQAIEAHDFPSAQSALEAYIACFQSRSRRLAEIEAARHLLAWGVQAAQTQKAQMAEDLMLLRNVVDAYGSPRRCHTWRLDG